MAKYNSKFSVIGLAMTAVLSLSAVGAGTLLLSSAPSASAQSNAKSIVDEAKAKGQVGETAEGYVHSVTGSVDVDVSAAVNEINIRRKAVYTRLAEEQNVSVGDVAKLTAERLIQKTRSGQMVRDGNGLWVRK